MNFELRHFDTPLLRFSCTEETNTPQIKILWRNNDKSEFLPLDLTPTEDGISKWLRHRAVPSNRAYVHNLQSEETLRRYAKTLLPCVYDDFTKRACSVIAPRHREGLRRLVDFKFKRHSRYNLPSERLKLLEKIVSDRAKELLQNG